MVKISRAVPHHHNARQADGANDFTSDQVRIYTRTRKYTSLSTALERAVKFQSKQLPHASQIRILTS